MTRKFLTLLLVAALSIAAGSMACISGVQEIDKDDETDGAT